MNEVIVIRIEEYNRLKKEHELLAILRSYGVEEWEFWNKAIDALENGDKQK